MLPCFPAKRAINGWLFKLDMLKNFMLTILAIKLVKNIKNNSLYIHICLLFYSDIDLH